MSIDLFSNYGFLGRIANEAKLAADLKKAETEATTVEAAPKKAAEKEAEKAPESKVTYRPEPIREVKELKPQKTDIATARTADKASEVVESHLGTLASTEQRTARITEKIERLKTKYLKRYESQLDEAQKAKLETIAALAEELKKARNMIVQVEEKGAAVAYQLDEYGIKSEQKVLQIFYSPEGQERLKALEEARVAAKEQLKAAETEIRQFQTSQLEEQGGEVAIKPRVLKYPLASASTEENTVEAAGDPLDELLESLKSALATTKDYVGKLKNLFA